MIKLHCATRGEFKVDVKRGGETVPLVPWQANLITNAGMDSLGLSGSNYGWAAIAVGSGNTTPQFTDTRLAARVAAVYSVGWTGSVLGNEVTFTTRANFPLGSVVGNISELGVVLGGISPSDTMATRALIRDGSGQPTTITVQAEDQLVVTYRLIFAVDQAISTQTLTDPASGIEYTLRAKFGGALTTDAIRYGLTNAAFGSASGSHQVRVGGVFNGPGEAPSGGSVGYVGQGDVSYAGLPYTPGSFVTEGGLRFSTTASALDRDGVNILEIGSYSPTGGIHVEFSPPFRKPSTSTASLRWRVSWARG